ncbi:protein-tyrosine phosphatase [Tenacibaculum adriaticum]|uniref:protein-tyrosine-phosphatase n=2 Tax=Tenacibaculum adriaticum TaxID=413713 RepID=A0A5S5DUM2_9FLAO|nr:low molecular weight protein-tyrosine-phosphatase [Tenacibaculum adriaticum]TYP99394.1 protein-tyrosine phosphatase [Tenacibaculum adriaticum]
MKILMVCLGNICRSPLAQGILESKVHTDRVYVDSAGTSGYHEGNLPDPRSIQTAKKYGIDITSQRSRKFLATDFDMFDVIYAMDESNFEDIIQLSRNKEEAKKVKLILDELSNEDKNVPDPYHGGDQGFENVYKMLEEACELIASKLN